MGTIKVIYILLKDCLVDIIIYLLDILLVIQLTFGKIIWFAVPENKKVRTRIEIAEKIKQLESEEKETNELALKSLRNYYLFIKEN